MPTHPATSTPAAELIAERIRRFGPLGFDEVMDVALYDPAAGFYETGGAAGRARGDFITSPEVGPLFGAVIARALDAWWRDMGEPDPYVVVDAGAGPGTLAVAVRAAEPDCASAMRYVLVERSAQQRSRHGDYLSLARPEMSRLGVGPEFVSLPDLPVGPLTGVVVANELLDNLPFAIAERVDGGWASVRVGLADDDRTLVELLVPLAGPPAELAATLAPGAPVGARVPLQTAALDWLRAARQVLELGRIVVLDYGGTTAELADRTEGWLRTYREHTAGGGVLEQMGQQDITADVALDQLSRLADVDVQQSQTDVLRGHGLDELVAEGARIWTDRAHIGDLAAIRGRSRVTEAEALTEPGGLGGFQVLEWQIGY
jgi:SAM-dependent MidA family methyltransferase